MSKIKVYIDAACDILYSSYYIKGFEQLNCKVVFTSKFFGSFKTNNHFLPIVIQNQTKLKKVIIDFGDGEGIDNDAYNWCDYYCKINIKFGDLLTNKKLVSIGPSFGIKLGGFFYTSFLATINYFKARIRVPNLKFFFSNYKATLNRLSIEKYQPEKTNKDYAFFVASIWKNELETNTFRMNFIKACKIIFKNKFEGGFAPRSKGDNLGFDEFVIDSRITLQEYLKNIKSSYFVFNTPAVLKCHGWKLAEYLALGKVIISNEISRELPSKLIDKENIIITDGSEQDIVDKMKYLLENDELYFAISEKSREYYDNFLSPKAVCDFIIKYNV